MNFINSQLTPDALAVVSIRKSHYVLIGCYKLETEQTRVGEILVYLFNGTQLISQCTLSSLSGILDIKELRNYSTNIPQYKEVPGALFITAQADSQLHILHLVQEEFHSVSTKISENRDSRPHVRLSLLQSIPLSTEPNTLPIALAVDSSSAPTADAPTSIYASDAAGFVHVLRASLSAPPELVARWRAHEFDCWCVASSDSCDRSELARLGESGGASCLLASGGDDAKLRLWDLRAVPTTAQSTSTSASASAIPRAAHILSAHNAGVTALAWHPTHSHVLASGSYDEQLLMWDVRQLGSPMARVQLGGGVWRIRWLTDPNLEDERSSSSSGISHLATATMHAGAHVLRLDLNRLGSTEKAIELVTHFTGHESMVYGIGWMPFVCNEATDQTAAASCALSGHRFSRTLVSCSFYDRSIRLWESGLKH